MSYRFLSAPLMALCFASFTACQAPKDRESSASENASDHPGEAEFSIASSGSNYTHGLVEFTCNGGDYNCPAIAVVFSKSKDEIMALIDLKSAYPKVTAKRTYTYYGCRQWSKYQCLGNPGDSATVVFQDESVPVKRVVAKFRYPDLGSKYSESYWNY